MRMMSSIGPSIGARAEMSRQQRPTAPHVRSIPGARRDDIEHRVHEVSRFIQEDRGEVVAADLVAFIQRHQQGFAG